MRIRSAFALGSVCLALSACGGGGGGGPGTFAQIGTEVEMPGDPGLRSTPAPEMTISLDGRTVFIGGFLGIVVMPAPSPQSE